MKLKQFPEDWDTFAKLGALVHASLSTPGHEKHLIYLDPGDPVPMRMAFLPSSGGRLFNMNLTRATFNSEESIDAFQFFAHLLENKTAKEWNNSTQGDPMQLLKTDRVFGNIAGPWFGKVLEAQIPEDAGKWRVAPFPRRRPDLPSTGLGGSCLVMPYNASNKPGAIELAKFMCTDDFAITYFSRVGSPPPIKSVWRNPLFDEPLPYFGDQSIYQVARRVIENSRPLQLLPNAEVVKNDFRWAMNEISTKGASSTKTLNIAAQRANETLRDESARN
jgi:ABC-type glycerol-3-phosphate transport system substrate-binding protein